MLRIELCADQCEWDRYVESHPKASNYHRWCWRQAIGDTFGHAPYYLSASLDGVLQGVLPLFSIRSRLFGNSLVSMPFFSYGGLLADSPEAGNLLIARAVELAGELGARRIELRQGHTGDFGWKDLAAKVTMDVPILGTVDELWNGLSARVRKRVRHARKAGFEARWGGIEDVRNFYPVFAANMRNLGTPAYPQSWFENLCRSYPDGAHVLTLWRENKPMAGAFLIEFRETLELPWAASLPESRRDFSPLLLYWTLLEWAAGRGFERVDLGRCTRGSGSHDFKKHWTHYERALHWYCWTHEGAAAPQLRPEDPRFRLATQVWKRLPLPIANQLGPRIVRGLP
jgi:serine/alanine adding enzyme